MYIFEYLKIKFTTTKEFDEKVEKFYYNYAYNSEVYSDDCKVRKFNNRVELYYAIFHVMEQIFYNKDEKKILYNFLDKLKDKAKQNNNVHEETVLKVILTYVNNYFSKKLNLKDIKLFFKTLLISEIKQGHIAEVKALVKMNVLVTEEHIKHAKNNEIKEFLQAQLKRNKSFIDKTIFSRKLPNELIINLLPTANEESFIQINSKDEYGLSALHKAVLFKNHYLIEQLLSLGIGINNKDLRGETALHLSVRNGCEESTNLLLKYGANINSRNKIDGNTPSHEAKDVKKLQDLYNFGANFRIKNEYNQTVWSLFNNAKLAEEKFNKFKTVIMKINNTDIYFENARYRLIKDEIKNLSKSGLII